MLGTISKSLEKRLAEMEIRGRIETIQSIAIVSSTLKNPWDEFLLRPQRKITVYRWCEKLGKSEIIIIIYSQLHCFSFSKVKLIIWGQLYITIQVFGLNTDNFWRDFWILFMGAKEVLPHWFWLLVGIMLTTVCATILIYWKVGHQSQMNFCQIHGTSLFLWDWSCPTTRNAVDVVWTPLIGQKNSGDYYVCSWSLSLTQVNTQQTSWF